MELPYLSKKKMNQGGGVVVAQVSDGKSDGEMMDAVAKEAMDAAKKDDVKGFRAALEALVLDIMDRDEMQDGEM